VPEDSPQLPEPPEIHWADNGSLLLTLRHAMKVVRTDPDLAECLIALAHSDAHQSIEDADLLITAVRGDLPSLWRCSATWPRASRAN
jgi:hypothetical protein